MPGFRSARCVAFLFAVVVAPCLGAQTSKDASFGVWPFLVGNMDPQISAIVAQARIYDLDTIYVNVFRTTGSQNGTLWISDRAGTWNPAWGPVRTGGKGIDLKALIAQARAFQIQVVGVVKCFDDSVQPTDAAHRAYVLQIVDYLMNSYDTSGKPVYDLDGLALDYVRFVGSGCSNSPFFVTDFVRQVKARLGVRSLHAYLIANRSTFHGPSYTGPFHPYGTVTSNLRSCYGQDWEGLSRYVDVMMPMAYTADGSIYNTAAEHQAYVQTAAAYARMACQRAGFPGRRVVPAIRCWTDSNETATTTTIGASIAGALAGGGDGYNAFRYKTMQSAWWPTLRLYAAAGPNRPVPELTANFLGQTAQLDATASSDFDQSSASLQVRYDWGNDGSFETAWITNQLTDDLAPQPGMTVLGVQVRDADGNVGASVRRYAVPNSLSAPATISSGTPSPLQLTLGAGPGAAQHSYFVLGGLSGRAPGTPWLQDLTVPLNVDGVTVALISAANTPVMQNASGTFGSLGTAASVFQVPPGVLSSVVGLDFTWTALGAGPNFQRVYVTNAATTTILP